MHFGVRAWQNGRPCQISWWENWTHFSCGIIFITSCSTFLGSSFRDKFRRFERRSTCVSTTTPLAIPYAVPSTTFAVLRATPGSVSISSIVRGTCPPNLSMIALLAPITDFVLFRKNPVGRMSCSNSPGVAYANAFGSGYRSEEHTSELQSLTNLVCRLLLEKKKHNKKDKRKVQKQNKKIDDKAEDNDI